MFDLALGWTILLLWGIASALCSIFILAIGFRLAQMRADRRRREQRLGYLQPPFCRG